MSGPGYRFFITKDQLPNEQKRLIAPSLFNQICTTPAWAASMDVHQSASHPFHQILILPGATFRSNHDAPGNLRCSSRHAHQMARSPQKANFRLEWMAETAVDSKVLTRPVDLVRMKPGFQVLLYQQPHQDGEDYVRIQNSNEVLSYM